MKTKVIRKTISLPEDVLQFAQRRSKTIAAEKSEQPNLSRYLKDLVLDDRKRQKQAA